MSNENLITPKRVWKGCSKFKTNNTNIVLFRIIDFIRKEKGTVDFTKKYFFKTIKNTTRSTET